MNIVSLSLLFLVILSLCYMAYAFFCTRVFFRKKERARGNAGKALPSVSIIKPVSNSEEGTLENLMSFCDQDYPDYEVIFSLSPKDESMIPLIEDLKKLLPNREIKWVIANRNRGPNYKVGNLIGAVQETKHEILALSDGDMRVDRNYLRQIVPPFLQEKAGLVTCLYRGAHLRNIFSGLQSLTVQTDFIPNVLIDHRLKGISYGFGATILTSKKVLASFGGLESLQEYLADDYQMGNQAYKKGYGIHLSPYLADHIFDTKNFWDYLLHHLRWAITQRVCRPIGYVASIVTRGIFLAFLFLILQGFSPAATALFLFICSVRVLSFVFLNKILIHNDEVTRYFWLIPMNDLLNGVIWFLSLFINTVHWKNRWFRVVKGGRIVEL